MIPLQVIRGNQTRILYLERTGSKPMLRSPDEQARCVRNPRRSHSPRSRRRRWRRCGLSSDLRSLTAQHGAAVVTVKFVMSVAASGKEERIEDSTQALLVSADGLLLVPDRAVSVDFGELMAVAQAPGLDRARGQVERVPRAPRRQRRLVAGRPGDARQPAWDRLVALAQSAGRRTELRQPGRRACRAEPGMTFFSLLRTSDEWGGVPVFHPGFIMGETQTPKSLLLVDGMPGVAFSPDGLPMGYVDVDFGQPDACRNAGNGLGLDMADSVLQMTPIAKVAAATHLAQKLPSMVRSK